MCSIETWRSKANRVLDDYERGVMKGRMSQGDLAKIVGVSRQTLWRDEALRERLRKIQELRAKHGNLPSARANTEMRIRVFQSEIARLDHENSLLIQNIVSICRKLREHGLDPRVFVSEAADDAKLASTRFLGD